MTRPRRWRLLWVVVLMVTLAGIVGANRLMHVPVFVRQTERTAQPPVTPPRAPAVVATGVVVPEGDIVPLIPSVKGEVKEVLVKTDDVVKKGQVLLRMDRELALETLREAEAGVEFAEGQLEEAKAGLRKYEIQREIQLKKIEARQKELAAAMAELDHLEREVERARQLNVSLPPTVKDPRAARLAVDALKAAIDAERLGLDLIEANKPTAQVRQAEAGLKRALALRDKAKLGVELCDLRAPADGTIMQSFVSAGHKFGDQAVKPAFLFYEGGLIVKADLKQEWAHRVKVGMSAVVQDAEGSGATWKGRVTKIGKSFLPKRDATGAIEGVGLLQTPQDPVLECRIELDNTDNPPFLNQKVRIHIGP
ncbi:MAG: HlyD family efflux transporter periplasmic adaptor subunit [Gemmataceae bacterium]|nr:HlyD family efflux transporter periplasmic adaptor subunit [Gemmataceae bacterium]